MTTSQLSDLPRARVALLRSLADGASVAEAAQATGWSSERVRLEALAAIAQLDPPVAVRAATPPVAARPARAAASSLSQRPALAPEVIIEPAPPAADHRVVHDPRTGRYLRVKLPQAAFLESLDGTRSLEELTATTSLPHGLAAALVAKFAELGLLQGTETPGDAPRRRAERGGAIALQLGLFDPGRLLARARPLIRTAGTPWALGAAALVALLGIVATAVNLESGLLTSERLADPVVLGTLLAAMLATAMLHELGHAGAVAYFGGRVKRMGFMLFYLLPALFCDTSDAWRFPFGRQRVVVALAGIAVQLVVVGLVAQSLWLGLGDAVQAWVLLYVLLNLGMCAYNLIPLVKLDGYWALSAAIDRPNLRTQAIARARAWARWVLAGNPLERARGDAALVGFGTACALFAPALIIYALLRWEDLLLRLGATGATIWWLLVLYVASRPAKASWAVLRAGGARPPAGWVRTVLPVGALGVVVAAALALVDVPTSAGGEIARAGARSYVATLDSGAVTLVSRWKRAELGDRSLTSGRTSSSGTVMRRSGDGWLVVLAPGKPRPRGDDVTVQTGRRSVASWLWHAHLRPAAVALWP